MPACRHEQDRQAWTRCDHYLQGVGLDDGSRGAERGGRHPPRGVEVGDSQRAGLEHCTLGIVGERRRREKFPAGLGNGHGGAGRRSRGARGDEFTQVPVAFDNVGAHHLSGVGIESVLVERFDQASLSAPEHEAVLIETAGAAARRYSPARLLPEAARWAAARVRSGAIAATTTRTGLSVHAGLDTGIYPTGIQVDNEALAAVALTRHRFHGD